MMCRLAAPPQLFIIHYSIFIQTKTPPAETGGVRVSTKWLKPHDYHYYESIHIKIIMINTYHLIVIRGNKRRCKIGIFSSILCFFQPLLAVPLYSSAQRLKNFTSLFRPLPACRQILCLQADTTRRNGWCCLFMLFSFLPVVQHHHK